MASQLRAGSIVVDTSTMEHGATMEIHSRLAAAGLEFLDAPVSGMQSRAEAGTLTVMCGGSEQTFEKVKPWLERMGNNVLYMGEAGSGQLTKLVNQLLFDINCAALAEILPMSRRMGLDPEKIASVINSGTGRSYASEFFLPRILDRHFSDGYPLRAAYKDLVSAAELGARHCIPMPVLAAATATYQMSLLTGHGSSDKGAMTRFFEDMLAVQFSAAAPETEQQNG
nr:NAD(P)-dependent oxidoreductase [Cupriavidus sp. amp6]